MRSKGSRPAFTLVELLVVIAIIGVLVALLLPAVNSAREAARRIQCTNNLRQVGLALANYESANGNFPQGMYSDPDPDSSYEQDGLSWMSKLLPYIEEQAVYDQIASAPSVISAITNAWDAGTMARAYGDGRQLVPGGNAVISAFVCPSVSSPDYAPNHASGLPTRNSGYATSHYKGSRGFCDRGVFVRPSEIAVGQTCFTEINGEAVAVETRSSRRYAQSIRTIKDGMTKTIFAGESAYYDATERWPIWIGGARQDEEILFKTEAAQPINCYLAWRSFDQPAEDATNDCALSWHVGGCQFVFGDASVRLISESVDGRTYEMLGDRADGSVLGDF